MDKYTCYKQLKAAEVCGKDFAYITRPRPGATVVVIAPHGGRIEPETAEIAKAIAGADFSFYCFKGLRAKSHPDLHIASHKFDEPHCVNLIATHKYVLAIHGHGCPGAGQVLLGGLDDSLIGDLARALKDAGLPVTTDVPASYHGKHPNNICNRGATKAGAQFELSLPFRQGKHVPKLVKVVRTVLFKRQNAV